MNVRFDDLNRYEKPVMFVCNPGCKYQNGMLTDSIGILSHTSDEEIVMNFNAVSELNFRLYRILLENDDDNTEAYNLYRSIQNRRVIFVESIGFFIITNVKDCCDDGLFYKDVQAESVDVELQSRTLTYIEDGTYLFSDIISTIVSNSPGWSLGTVDTTVNALSRTFEDVDEDLNVLDFLLEDMQEAYECIFVFDIINREIDVYDQNTFTVETDIHITKDDVINNLNITEDVDDLYTCISVFGDNDLNIVAINPLGNNNIYNFDHYLSWMSSSLATKVTAWQNAIDAEVVAGQIDSRATYYSANLDYYNKLTQKYEYEYDIERYSTIIDMYKRCRENIVAEGSVDEVSSYNEAIRASEGEEITIYEEIEETIEAIDDLISETDSKVSDTQTLMDALDTQISSLKESISTIRSTLSLSNYFTSSELAELDNYIFQGSYDDEYTTVTDSMSYSEKFAQMKVLYDRAVKQLEKISKPTQEFDIDVENFIFNKDFEEWSDQIQAGCVINVEIADDEIAELFLSSMTINYDDCTLSLTFGNRLNRFDIKSLYNDVLGDVRKTSNSIGYIRDVISPIKNGDFDEMKSAIEMSRTLTKNAALSSSSQEIIIDDTGYTGRKINGDGNFDLRQIKINNNTIVFTDDGWDTCKTAIGEIVVSDDETTYGVNAETIVGDMIIGRNLNIKDSNGEDLLSVVDDRITTNVSGLGSRVTQLEQTSTSVGVRVTALENEADQTSITTTTGFSFGENGLNISKSDSEISNIIDENGMRVVRGDDTILRATTNGVSSINLTAKQYLTIGTNCRFEDFATDKDENRTGCFFVGTRLIQFDVIYDGTTLRYFAEPDATFGEWVETDYNTGGWEVDSTTVSGKSIIVSSTAFATKRAIKIENGSYVESSTAIEHGDTYVTLSA